LINILYFKKEELGLAVDQDPPVGGKPEIGGRGY
jgi:hypothetical protein